MQATKKKTLWQRIRRDHQLLILLIPGLLFYAIFRYGPMYGIVIAFSHGLINRVITATGGQAINFLIRPEWYRFIYILSGVWAGLGSGAIVYLAALAGVDQQLYEAARIDGCTRVKMIWYMTLPSILPTIVTMFLLGCGNIMRIGPDKALLLYNSMTYEVADIFSTYVYRIGLVKKNFSFATAVGLFESVIAVIVLLAANTASRRITGESLW